MRKATVQYNSRTNRYEVLVIGRGVRHRAKTAAEAYEWADCNGYDLVEYD